MASLEEMKRYVRFGPTDEAELRQLLPLLRPYFTELVDLFYERISEHPRALAVIQGGQAQVERLKGTLLQWLEQTLSGPWDDAYFQDRARIGRRHVEIQLPQEYNFTAMNVVREYLLHRVVQLSDTPEQACLRVAAIDKLLDLELAIVLFTYSEDYMAKLQRHERFATFGQLTSTIGHELRNPLGVIESSVYLLRRRVGQDEETRRHLDKIHGQVARSNRIISSMLDIVRERVPVRERIAPGELVRRATQLLRDERDRAVELVIPEGLPHVRVDTEQFQQVLHNLLLNADDAAEPGGRVRVSVTARDGYVEFAVEDDGPGIHEEVRPRLFEPLVTTKDTGVGLGLALCKKLVLAHEGTLTAGDSADLGGASFCIRLAAVTSAPPSH